MGKVEDIARRYFPKDFTDRERAIFEAGIALGALTHSAVGLPAASTVAPYIEKALAKSFMLQPYRREVKVRLRRIPRRPRLYRYGLCRLKTSRRRLLLNTVLRGLGLGWATSRS
jgi:hypothetical protein